MTGEKLELTEGEVPQFVRMETAEFVADLHHLIPRDYFFFPPSPSFGMAFWKAAMMRS